MDSNQSDQAYPPRDDAGVVRAKTFVGDGEDRYYAIRNGAYRFVVNGEDAVLAPDNRTMRGHANLQAPPENFGSQRVPSTLPPPPEDIEQIQTQPLQTLGAEKGAKCGKVHPPSNRKASRLKGSTVGQIVAFIGYIGGLIYANYWVYTESRNQLRIIEVNQGGGNTTYFAGYTQKVGDKQCYYSNVFLEKFNIRGFRLEPRNPSISIRILPKDGIRKDIGQQVVPDLLPDKGDFSWKRMSIRTPYCNR